MAKKPKPKPEEPIAGQFSITLKVGTETYHATGNSLAEAFQALEAPEKISIKSFITFEGNGKRLERMMLPVKMRQFLRPAYRAIQAKQVMAALQ